MLFMFISHYAAYLLTGMAVNVQQYLNKEYEVECDGQMVKLKPVKAWVLQPKGRKGVVIGLFKCPNGKTIRKAIGKIE
jgi:hypothetical protein